MLNWMESGTIETQLAEERPRLVRLCAWLTGSPAVAEDLAQEVLLVAWKSRDQLWSAEKLTPWLTGIARNICLDWSRRRQREQTRQVFSVDASAEAAADHLSDQTNLELDLDRSELAQLLDQALALLPVETARLLIEHYLEETPHTAIAEKRNIKPGTVAVRIQRGKMTLQRILQTQLQEEAVAFGLSRPDSSDWEETNIWCPLCGQSRMLGQFQRNQPGGRFALRCPACNPDPESIMVGLDLTKPCYARLLGHIKAYKPAYTRIKTFIGSYYHQALAVGAAACPACGQPVIITVDEANVVEHSGVKPPRYPTGEILIYCSTCDWASNSTSAGLALALPEAQRFWRENPRIRTLPDQLIESQGVPAIVTRLESITSAASLAVVTRRDTFEPLKVYTNTRA